ncbi:hypothetical protein [Flavobacterium columnare]|uniref:hypothetical protein n=2 Tax=Flavobacterium columnare TaxID=996 RepID=UPI0018967519|nr:hypothetical protein [Flavobacterium columnare]MBF6659368.1 hypothetical protein [Flavobacterium columnare]
MSLFNYYLVKSLVKDEPFYTTCADIDGRFFRISDLESYLKNGKDGISNEEIIATRYFLIRKDLTIQL